MSHTMEQGGKHAAIGCLGFEHDPLMKSFATGHNKDVALQAVDSFVCAASLEPSMMSSPYQVQDPYDGAGVADGKSVPDVAPSTPCPSFLQQKSQKPKLTKMAHALPSLCLGIGLSEGQQVPCIQRLITPEKLRSLKELSQQPSMLTSSPQSIFITPIEAHEARLEVQRETLEPFKEALVSSKLCKHEKYAQECLVPHPVLSLGNVTETLAIQESLASPRNLRFSFLEALTAGDTIQEKDFARLPISEAECAKSIKSGFALFEPGFVSSDQSKSLTPINEKKLHCESEANSGVLVANTDVCTNSLPNPACTVLPPIKQEWSIALKQFPHLYQALSQDKNVVMSACNNESKSGEKRRKLLFSQENLASGVADKLSKQNSGLHYSNAPSQKIQYFEQCNGGEALEVASCRKTSGWLGQPIENSTRPVNLSKVKVELDYEEPYGGQHTCVDSAVKNNEIGKCNGKPPFGTGFLGSSSAAVYVPPTYSLLDIAVTLQEGSSNLSRNSACTQLPQVLSIVSAGGPSLCLHNEQSQIDGCWGKFLALSANTGCNMTKADTEITLPFHSRFKHLQEYLKQCDTSDKYSLQEFRSLSAAAMSSSAVELETRAVRLFLEEGKQLKRMKLLNVLGKASEGLYADSNRAVYAPWLLTSQNIVQVKQEM